MTSIFWKLSLWHFCNTFCLLTAIRSPSRSQDVACLMFAPWVRRFNRSIPRHLTRRQRRIQQTWPATDNIQGAEQMGVVNCSARSARAIVAGVVALLIVLQGLTSVGSSFARPLGGEEKASFLGSILSVACANTQDHNRSPKHAHDFSKCCILCGGRDLTGTALFILPKSGGMNPLPRALVAIAKYILVAPRIVVLGWTSTWSSRAPPSFS